MKKKEVKMKQYLGHRSWNAWNVSMHLGSTESIYFYAVDLVRKYGKRKAVNILHSELPEKTPDGAKYNKLCLALAIEGLEID